MHRLMRSIFLALALLIVTTMAAAPVSAASQSRSLDHTLLTGQAGWVVGSLLPRELAQLGQFGTPTAVPTATPRPTRTPSPTATPAASPTATAQATMLPSPTPADAEDEASAAQTAPDEEQEGEDLPTPTVVAATATPVAPLEGTIIANRSVNTARFFVEGITYDLEPGRSLGLALPRTTSVLNLYNCDAATPENQATCFWDPYLITLDGFYEIYNAQDAAVEARLLLREAGQPPIDQVWVQNRTDRAEQLVYKSEVFDLLPTTTHELPVTPGAPTIVYVKSCITLSGQTVCEWAPKTLEPGVYYAMVGVSSAGSEPNSQIQTLDLRPVVAGVEQTPTPTPAGQAAPAQVEAAPSATVTPMPGQVACRLLVPTLNVRSGPGLQYEIIDKVRSGEEPAVVLVNGRSVDGEWLTVVPVLVDNGWITASSSFVTCDADLSSLPMIEAPAPPPTPVPAPLVDVTPAPAPDPQGQPDAPAPDPSAPAEPAEGETPAGSAVPEGQALLLVNNGFQYPIRFTLDQRYRPQEGPSEYDLEPGASVSIVVFPGQVDFSASSPWGGLSGNASLLLEADQSMTLWLRFEPDAGNSGQWNLAWQ